MNQTIQFSGKMEQISKRIPVILKIFLILFCLFPTSFAQTIEEWEVPYGAASRPRDPFVAPDGQIWFVGQFDDYAARFNPENGEFTRFDLPEGAGPHNIIVDDWGRPYYTGNADAHIGRIDPVTGEITRFDTPVPEARDPHTQMFALDGGLWFTSQSGGSISRLDTGTGEVDVLVPPTSGSRPYGLVRAPNGILWADLFGTNKLARIDPIERTLEEIALPRPQSRPRRIGVTSDGMIWYGDYATGYLGRYNPETEEFDEWPLPGGSGAAPYAMATDGDDKIWLVETGSQPNMMVRFDPVTETFTSEAIPSGAGVVRHMVFDPKTGTLWYGSDLGTLGGVAASDPSSVEHYAQPGQPSVHWTIQNALLKMNLSSPLQETHFQMKLNTLNGKEAFNLRFEDTQSISIPLALLSDGVYFYSLQSAGTYLSGRLKIIP